MNEILLNCISHYCVNIFLHSWEKQEIYEKGHERYSTELYQSLLCEYISAQLGETEGLGRGT